MLMIENLKCYSHFRTPYYQFNSALFVCTHMCVIQRVCYKDIVSLFFQRTAQKDVMTKTGAVSAEVHRSSFTTVPTWWLEPSGSRNQTLYKTRHTPTPTTEVHTILRPPETTQVSIHTVYVSVPFSPTVWGSIQYYFSPSFVFLFVCLSVLSFEH